MRAFKNLARRRKEDCELWFDVFGARAHGIGGFEGWKERKSWLLGLCVDMLDIEGKGKEGEVCKFGCAMYV